MFQITKEIHFHMGHRVPNHKSKCRNPHGHTYHIEICLEGDIVETPGVSEEGMLMDFGDVKIIAKGFTDEFLDHGFMYHCNDAMMKGFFEMYPENKSIAVDFIPTSENLAKFLFDSLAPKYQSSYGNNLKLKSITVHETPTSHARYAPNS